MVIELKLYRVAGRIGGRIAWKAVVAAPSRVAALDIAKRSDVVLMNRIEVSLADVGSALKTYEYVIGEAA